MEYLLSFLEGIITFISPCMLPMLPIYISYFTGQNNEDKKQKTIYNAVGFVLGFTIVFMSMGAFAGAIGSFLLKYQTTVNIIAGILVILFGLSFMGILKLPFIGLNKNLKVDTKKLGFISSLLFGMIFAIGWTPCVGAFLGSALMLAASSGGALKGILMLLSFSLGLGVPFVVSAVLIDKLKSTFNFIKRNYKIINFLSGLILIIAGLFMALGSIHILN